MTDSLGNFTKEFTMTSPSTKLEGEWTSFEWNWTDFCSTGLTPWIANSNDLLPCFQEICLQLPVYTLFATLSSYNFGSLTRTVIRNSKQLRLIYCRIISAIVLAGIPIARTFYLRTHNVSIFPADILIACAQCITWIVHVGYLLSLRRYGGFSHRGPLFLNVIWTTIFALDIIWLRTSTRYNYWGWSLVSVIIDCIYLLSLIPTGSARIIQGRITDNQETESLISNRYVHFATEFNETFLGHAQDEANCLSKLVFSWVDPLIQKGVAGNLKKIEDLFDLPDSLNVSRIVEKLRNAIYSSSTLVRALHKAFGKEFYLIGILKLISDVAGFAGPLLLGGLLNESTTENAGTDSRPYFYAIGLLLSTLISAFFGTHFNWRMAIVGMKMRTGIVSSIYRKALEARELQEARPEILNLMSTDTDRIVNSCISFHSFWSIPFQLFTTLYLLYTQMGVAFIAGVIFAASLIPINRWLAMKIASYSGGLMSAKDHRLTATSETILGAKQIKLQAWEDIFIRKIRDLRKTEVDFLSNRKYLDALCVYFWATTPVLMCLLTFGASVLSGHPLTAASTYTSVALLNMLIAPLNAFPWVLNGLVEAWISIKRVQELFDLSNLVFSDYYDPIFDKFSKTELRPPVIQIKNATFEYEAVAKQESDFIFKLENINMDVRKDDLVCIEGPVGSGKSTLISAMVAELKCTDGNVCVQDLNSGFGYVPQSPWLQRGTIRENILWGSVYDESRYKNVIYSCALLEDLSALGGDQSGVGENGRNLSGGQRVRIALARAVYQDKKIYLMDDILASVDAHVANHIIKHCILGLLKNKTRIIVTQSRALFYHANQILHMENGKLSPSKYMSESFDPSDEEEELPEKSMNLSTKSLEDKEDDDKKSIDSVLLEESREYGHLSTNVLSCYWKAMSTPIAITVLLFVVLMQLSRNLSDTWLAYWVTSTNVHNSNNTNNETINYTNTTVHTTGYYLGIYSAIALFNSILTLGRAFLFAYAGIKAAKFIHDKLLQCVIYAKFYFFDITSAGRILNRFSSDTYNIDDSLPFILNILLAQVAGLIGAICVCLFAMPWLALIIVPLCPIYIHLQNQYRSASRDIKRLSSNALSPLYAHFTETLQGLTTIRAMRANLRFQKDFHIKLEESIKTLLTTASAQQWLSIRLQLLGSTLVGGAGILAAVTSTHATNSGFVGLSISYALSITGLLSGVLNAFAETEQEMIAVERISQYLELEKEDTSGGTINPPFGWPNQGVINFNNVSLTYREHLSPALVGLNIKTDAFERIAIVGRTGAGKTSIFSALLRVAPLLEGEICVDCVNLRTLALKILRDRIVVIPQEPFLFEGTVRENLDPRKKHIDSEIWNALTNCLATPLVQSLGGLEGKLEKGGANLSAGQKQLLCLSRALLKHSKIVCIDEGTSHLDGDSEAAIQIILKNAFRSSTVLYIAHRLRGLQRMDRIIVMDNGKVIEEGTPKELAENSDSFFYSMLQEQQQSSDFLNEI